MRRLGRAIFLVTFLTLHAGVTVVGAGLHAWAGFDHGAPVSGQERGQDPAQADLLHHDCSLCQSLGQAQILPDPDDGRPAVLSRLEPTPERPRRSLPCPAGTASPRAPPRA